MNTILESCFETIFKHLAVDEIFLWTYNRNGITQHIVQVHIQNRRAYASRERCERQLRNMEDYQFTFYNSKEVQTLINQGLGRLYLICQPGNRIYLNPDHKSMVILPDFSTAELITQTVDYTQKEKDKIIAFMHGHDMYYNEENYPQAAFMLHQALELSFRTAQKLLIGSEKRSHSLLQNINFFKAFDHTLGNLCYCKTEELAINRLNESYTGSRYKQNFVIDVQKIEFCRDIAERILTWIEQYKQELLLEIENQLTLVNNVNPETITPKTKINMEKSSNINNSHRDLIHNTLESYGKVHALYCFAYAARQDSMCNLLNIQQSHSETHHYYLFAIMSKQNRPIMELQNLVMQLLPKKIKVTLIAETPDQLEKKLKKGDIFRTNLLQMAECWYKEKDFIKVGEQATKEVYLGYHQERWKKRYSNARGLNLAVEDCSYDMGFGTTAYLLALSLEQTCLGLLNDHLYYTPDSTNLNYLMDLCEIFYPDISSVFVRHSEQQQGIFSILVEAQNKYRYSTSFFVGTSEIEVLRDNVIKFNDSTNEFMCEYFQQQKVQQEAKERDNIEQCA